MMRATKTSKSMNPNPTNPPPSGRNLWPYGIILTFILFISGIAGLVGIACTQKSDLVSANYYEEEVRFQTQIDRFERARGLDAPARIAYDPAQKRITVTLPPGHASAPTSGRIQFYRPSAAGLDQSLDFKPDPSGVQSFDARNFQAGLWKVRVFWTANGNDYRVDQKVVIEAKGS